LYLSSQTKVHFDNEHTHNLHRRKKRCNAYQCSWQNNGLTYLCKHTRNLMVALCAVLHAPKANRHNHTHTHKHTHTQTHTHMQTHKSAQTHTQKRTTTHTHTSAQSHSHTHNRTHTLTHLCKRAQWREGAACEDGAVCGTARVQKRQGRVHAP